MSAWRGLACVIIPIAGCSLFHTTMRPAAYGVELETCRATASTWDQYVPCCINVAHKYGRDPLFCLPNAMPIVDAGGPDGR